jgi:biotin transport system substrate-specific component
MALYLVLGVIGLPIFTDGGSGSLVGMTSGGYVIGFVFAAALVGWLAQREWDHRIVGTAVSFLAGSAVMYLFGLPWLYVTLQGLGIVDPLGATLAGGLYPFLLGDALKAVVAATVLPLTWNLVARADAEAAEHDGI